MLKYKQGDLIEAFEDGDCKTLLHQENCESKYYAGFAKKIHDKYKTEHYIRCFGNIDIHLIIGDYKRTIISLYSQYYRGQPSDKLFKDYSGYEMQDNFYNRTIALKNSLLQFKHRSKLYDSKIGIPLIASGLAADKRLKGTMTDLEYFKKYIAPIVEEELKDLDVTVYYL
jgi:hypothetical protein